MHPTSYGSPTIHGETNTVHVGKYSSIANSAVFDGGMGHNPRFATTYPLWRLGIAEENNAGKCRGDIHIGNDVWIGDGALIMSGIRIGDGAIVGARAVVTKDVLPYRIVVGAPARWMRNRFFESQIGRLLAIKWWDWPENEIAEFAPLMLSENIEAFLNAAEAVDRS